ncbi:hypothetical protein [Rhodococcoides kroppenstedtii]|uniref:hypothetical protein n=1 Tax=Rhodococcoides kroppenstedtii TaxID=293050 RepID=UPI001427E256|nr:hypothetical protein [Rhodococcus kroppenstedtii]
MKSWLTKSSILTGSTAILGGLLVGGAATHLRFAPQIIISAIVLALAIVTDREFRDLPTLLRPGVVVVLGAVGAGLFSLDLDPSEYETYLSLWTLQLLGFAAGLILFGRYRRETQVSDVVKPEIISHLPGATNSIKRIAAAMAIFSFLAFMAFITTRGLPILGSDVEQGRVDAASTGTGYLRLVIYLIVPVAILMFCVHAKSRWALMILAVAMIVGLGNRSPLLYVLAPIVLTALLSTRPRGPSNKTILLIGLTGAIAVAAIGTFRIASQEEFASYSEYREDLADGDYAGVAWTSVSQYARVVAQNAVLTKQLVDSDQIDLQLGQSYLTLFITALPGEQLSLDRTIKEASGRTFVGGGTPPTFMGEGYANLMHFGTLLSSALLVGVSRFFCRAMLSARAQSGFGSVTSRLKSAIYGYVLVWSVMAQVAGLAGASTVPLAGFLVLFSITSLFAASKERVHGTVSDRASRVGSTAGVKSVQSKHKTGLVTSGNWGS